MMKHYEYTYLTRQDMDETGAKNLSDKLAASIQAKQGVVGDLGRAYKKRLAFRIKHQDVAYVNTILFQLEPAAVVEFKKETDGIAEIIRGLFISYDPEKLKREPRRERPARIMVEETVLAEKAQTFETKEPAPVAEEKIEAPKEKEVKEEKKEAKEEEKKPAEKKSAEEPKETKNAKPKRIKKAKAELRDIEQKLDEILK